MDRRGYREYSLWLAVFSITSAFQFWRASFLDGLIFLIVITGLTITAFSKNSSINLGNNPSFKKYGALYLGAIAFVLLFAPVHEQPAKGALVALLPLLLISREKHEHPAHSISSMARSTVAWSALAVIASVWELASYILGSITGNDARTPTISMLVDPFLQHAEGRFIFIFIWTLIGYELLFVRKSR